MGYEVTPMDASAGASAKPLEMREERVLSPYEGPKWSKIKPKIGQTSISEGQSLEEEKDKPSNVEEPAVNLSPAAAALLRKEQKFRREQQELKAKELALDKERLEIAEFKSLKEKISKKDYSELEKYIPYDEYTNYLIEKSGEKTPEQEELVKLRGDLDSVKKAHEDEVTKRFDAAVSERRRAVKDLVDKVDTSFKHIKKAGMEEAVVQHILDTWENDSIDLTPEVAAKEVEDLLKEHAAKWAAILADDVPKSVEEPTDTKVLPPLKPQIKTLTNNLAPSGEIKTPTKPFNGMNDQERWAEARRRVEERMKKLRG